MTQPKMTDKQVWRSVAERMDASGGGPIGVLSRFSADKQYDRLRYWIERSGYVLCDHLEAGRMRASSSLSYLPRHPMTQPKRYEFSAEDRARALASLPPLASWRPARHTMTLDHPSNAAAWKKHPARNVAEVGWLRTPVNLPKPTKPRAVRPKVRKLTVESTQVRTLIKKSA